jgi:succinyl-diaminopimelate desuccinylase
LEEFGIKPELSTSGGTSDARHFAELGIQVIELGPNNKTIHQYDEFILVDELNKLTEIYLKVLQKIAAK